MKRILLSGTMFLAALSAMNAVEPVKDPAVYQPVEGVYIQSLWMYTPKTNNVHPMMGSTETRGMTCVDDKVYLPLRGTESHQINEFDAATGAFLKTYTLPYTVNGNSSVYSVNDLQSDSKGNLASCNLTLNLQTGKFFVWRMKKGAYDKPEELLAWTWGNQGQKDGLRIDYFDVYGDVYGNGYILAAMAGEITGYSNIVFKWNIVDGVASSEPDIIDIFDYIPAGITTNGLAPRVRAISNEHFYLDPSNAHASLYDMGGNRVDGFNTSGVCTTNSVANGVEEFSLGDRIFLVAANNDHNTKYTPNNVVQLFDISNTMADSKSLGLLPAGGIGTLSNSARTVQPVIRKVNDNTVDLFIHGGYNGVAAYRLSLNPLSVDAEKMSAMNIHLAGSELVFSEEAAKVDVYAVAGNCVAQFANVNRANLSLVKGIYIVKAMDMAGKTKVQKIVVE